MEQPGGEVDGVGMKVSDIAPMTKGQRVLVFIKSVRGSVRERAYGVVGKGQGVYKIRDGIARKEGFTVAGRANAVENNIPIEVIKERIRRVEK